MSWLKKLLGSNDPEKAARLCNEGVQRAARGRMKEALALYEKAVAADDGYALAHLNRGLALQDIYNHQRNKLDEGERFERLITISDALERAVELDPTLWKGWRCLGHVSRVVGRFARAMEAFEQVLETSPEDFEHRGEARRQVGLLRPKAERQRALSRAIDVAWDPDLPLDDVDAALELAAPYAQAELQPPAETDDEAEGPEPTDPRARAMRTGAVGPTASDEALPSEGASSEGAASNAAASNAVASNAVASDAEASGPVVDDTPLAGADPATEPLTPEANWALGVLYRRKEALDEARRHFERCVQGDPAHLRARRELASVCLHDGRLDEALAHSLAAYQEDPANPALVCNVGVCHLGLGHLAPAREFLEMARGMAPKDPIVQRAWTSLEEKEAQGESAPEVGPEAG